MENDIRCPVCGSSHIRERNIGKKGGAIIGGISGALNGTDAETNIPVINTISAPHAVLLLSRFVTGAAVGAITCSALDGVVFDRFKCVSCEHTFN